MRIKMQRGSRKLSGYGQFYLYIGLVHIFITYTFKPQFRTVVCCLVMINFKVHFLMTQMPLSVNLSPVLPYFCLLPSPCDFQVHFLMTQMAYFSPVCTIAVTVSVKLSLADVLPCPAIAVMQQTPLDKIALPSPYHIQYHTVQITTLTLRQEAFSTSDF